MLALRRGYTLYEVIITLLIIGLIAYFMIFDMVYKVHESEYIIGLKRLNTELSLALNKIKINNGGYINIGLGSGGTYNESLRRDFCNVIKCVKTDTTSNIFGAIHYRWYDGDNIRWPGRNDSIPAVITNEGYFIRFYSYSDCSHANINACGYIDVDINGKKAPNRIGKDLYSFWIVHNKNNYAILPIGILYDGYNCYENDWGCTALRLINPAYMP